MAVLQSHPIQYSAPLYAFLNQDPIIDLTALYCTDFTLRGGFDKGFGRKVTWDTDLLLGYRSVFLGERATKREPGGFFSLVCPEVWQEIRSGKYDAVWLHGYGYLAYVLAFFAAKSCGIPILMRSETHLRLTRALHRRWLRDFVLRIAYRFVDRFLAIGTANREYYSSLGITGDRIFDVPYVVDNAHFSQCLPLKDRAYLRGEFGLPASDPVILFASKLSRRKHPEHLVRAVQRLREEHLPRATLFVVGSGEMEQELRLLARQLGIEDGVVFGGFLNQAELPRAFAASDVFVLPSENEPWGLVVNEAMAAGLPVVVSDEVGCARDLVQPGINGELVGVGDVPSLARALARILSNEERRNAMAGSSTQIIQSWSFEEARQGLVNALRSCPDPLRQASSRISR